MKLNIRITMVVIKGMSLVNPVLKVSKKYQILLQVIIKEIFHKFIVL